MVRVGNAHCRRHLTMRWFHTSCTLAQFKKKNTRTKGLCDRGRSSILVRWPLGLLLIVEATALLGPSLGMAVKMFESLGLNSRP